MYILIIWRILRSLCRSRLTPSWFLIPLSWWSLNIYLIYFSFPNFIQEIMRKRVGFPPIWNNIIYWWFYETKIIFFFGYWASISYKTKEDLVTIGNLLLCLQAWWQDDIDQSSDIQICFRRRSIIVQPIVCRQWDDDSILFVLTLRCTRTHMYMCMHVLERDKICAKSEEYIPCWGMAAYKVSTYVDVRWMAAV